MFHRKSRGDQDNTGTKWRIVHTSQPLVLSSGNHICLQQQTINQHLILDFKRESIL
jgi:hypothetical protein